MRGYLKDNGHDVWKAIYQNYLYGFSGWMIPVSVVIGNYWICAVTAYIFYSMLSIVVNREKYVTNLGKYFWFPLPAMLGALSAIFAGEFIKTFMV